MRRALLLTLLAVPAAAFAGFRASSFKVETRGGETQRNAAAALDGDLATCWMVDPEESNEGSWFEIDVPKSTIDKLSLVVGWDRDETTWADYPRAKTFKVEVFDEGKDGAKVLEHTVTLADQRGWQTVDLPDTTVGDEVFGGKVRLTVQEVVPGLDYPNLAVSELLLVLGEVDAPVALTEEPEGTLAGKSTAALTDKDARSFWATTADGAGTTFTVESDGFGVSSVGIQAGPKTHARPKTIKLIANKTTRTYTAADTDAMQWFAVPAVVGFTGSGWGPVQVEIVDTYPGTQPGVAIAEVALKATSYGGL